MNINKGRTIDLEKLGTEMPTYGCMLHYHRMISGLTLSEFQTITGIDKGLMSKYENDKRIISETHMDILSSFFDGDYDKEVESFLYEKERKTENQVH